MTELLYISFAVNQLLAWNVNRVYIQKGLKVYLMSAVFTGLQLWFFVGFELEALGAFFGVTGCIYSVWAHKQLHAFKQELARNEAMDRFTRMSYEKIVN